MAAAAGCSQAGMCPSRNPLPTPTSPAHPLPIPPTPCLLLYPLGTAPCHTYQPSLHHCPIPCSPPWPILTTLGSWNGLWNQAPGCCPAALGHAALPCSCPPACCQGMAIPHPQSIRVTVSPTPQTLQAGCPPGQPWLSFALADGSWPGPLIPPQHDAPACGWWQCQTAGQHGPGCPHGVCAPLLPQWLCSPLGPAVAGADTARDALLTESRTLLPPLPPSLSRPLMK